MKKICLVACLSLLMPFLLMSQTASVVFSNSGGFYENSFDLTLSCNGAYQIRYTTNGATPTASSTLYTGPLHLDENLYSDADIYTIQISPDDLVYIPDYVNHAIVLRAAAFDNNGECISATVTNTYFIHSLGSHGNGMAVVSICADSLALFDYDTGIFVPGVNFDPNFPESTGNYYQRGEEWERPVNVEFYEPSDNSGINQKCGLRTHGNRVRRYPSKGMKIYAREEYGKKRFKHTFFEGNTMNSFKHLVLKPFSSFWPYAGVHDYVCYKLAIQLGLPTSDCRPIVVYLNGEYWGIYFLEEKMDERFLEDHYDVNPDDCNIIGNWYGSIENGSNSNFYQMMNWFANANLADNAVYQQACSLIDINNFIDYYVYETFIANWDWPNNNMRCWQVGDSIWRWLFFDGDGALVQMDFDVFPNAAISDGPQTLVFRKLLDNEQFSNAFKSRAYELCDELFTYANTYPFLNEIVEDVSPEIENHIHRFNCPTSTYEWNIGIAYINYFLQNRVDDYLQKMNDFELLGIDEFLFDNNTFVCFPNPAKDVINITMFNNSSEVEINIYDVTGRTVYKKSLSTNSFEKTLSISPNLDSGIYLIKINNSTQRIIIQ